MTTINSDIFTWKRLKDKNHFVSTICKGDMPEFEGRFFNVRSVKTGTILTFSVNEQELVDNEFFDGELTPFHATDKNRKFTINLVNDF